MAAARAGQWKAVEFLYNRIYGRPTEHVITESQESRLDRLYDNMSTDELTRIVHRNNPQLIRQLEESGTLKRVEEMTQEERDNLLRAVTFQPHLRAVEDEPDQKAAV